MVSLELEKLSQTPFRKAAKEQRRWSAKWSAKKWSAKKCRQKKKEGGLSEHTPKTGYNFKGSD